MKKILFAILLLSGSQCFAQLKIIPNNNGKPIITLKGDTLSVPVGSCKVIKIGDKYYEVEVNLKEVPAPLTISSDTYHDSIWRGGGIQLAPFYTPNSSENLKSN